MLWFPVLSWPGWCMDTGKESLVPYPHAHIVFVHSPNSNPQNVSSQRAAQWIWTTETTQYLPVLNKYICSNGSFCSVCWQQHRIIKAGKTGNPLHFSLVL